MQNQYFYETEVRWTGARRGVLVAEGLPRIDVSAPPEFHGEDRTWTPEHLFVAAVNSCYMATFASIVEVSKLDILSFACKATGRLEKVDGQGYRVTEVALRPTLVVKNQADFERGARLLEKALKHCFISKSVRSEVTLSPEITIEQATAATATN